MLRSVDRIRVVALVVASAAAAAGALPTGTGGTESQTLTLGTLRWTRQDNGRDLKWADAQSYCASLTMGGYTDWRLPALSELQALAGSEQHRQITLGSCCLWSSDRGSGAKQLFYTNPSTGLIAGRDAPRGSYFPSALGVNFGNRSVIDRPIDEDRGKRALCVRNDAPRPGSSAAGTSPAASTAPLSNTGTPVGAPPKPLPAGGQRDTPLPADDDDGEVVEGRLITKGIGEDGGDPELFNAASTSCWEFIPYDERKGVPDNYTRLMPPPKGGYFNNRCWREGRALGTIFCGEFDDDGNLRWECSVGGFTPPIEMMRDGAARSRGFHYKIQHSETSWNDTSLPTGGQLLGAPVLRQLRYGACEVPKAFFRTERESADLEPEAAWWMRWEDVLASRCRKAVAWLHQQVEETGRDPAVIWREARGKGVPSLAD